MQKEEAAKTFWEASGFYPSYPFIKERRKYELDYLLEHIPNETESLLDLGCGNGSTTILLRELTYIKKFYCYDISTEMLNTIGENRDSELITQRWDGNNQEYDFPAADVTISMNMFPYIFDDAILESIIANVQSDVFLVRVTCDSARLEIEKYSADLGKHYAACYRTPIEYLKILDKYYTNVTVTRAFPDEIESHYGSKQYFFTCKR
jgi:SAM-dependent methyltransferase